MVKTIKTHVLVPLFQRLGTASATILIGYGLQADLSHQVGAFVVAAGGIAFDLIFHFMERRKLAANAYLDGAEDQIRGRL